MPLTPFSGFVRITAILKLLAAAMGCCALFSANLHGQTWRQIGGLPPAADLRCAYFWDTAHGVVGGVGCIYTYNSGVWQLADVEESLDTVKSLRLRDTGHLYAACGSTDVLVSTNRGATWGYSGSGIKDADDVYWNPGDTLCAMNLHGTGLMTGTTFARVNALSCVAARDRQDNPVYSTNGGDSWIASGSYFIDLNGYCAAADSCSETFYILTDGPKIILYKSTDGGNSWLDEYDFIDNAVDVLDGGPGGVLYVKGARNQIWRSENGGKSFSNIWTPVGTIHALDDRRMFSFGTDCRSLVVLDSGSVWMWDDSTTPMSLDPGMNVRPLPALFECDTELIPVIIWTSLCNGTPISVLTNSVTSDPTLAIDSARSNLNRLADYDTIWFRTSWLTTGDDQITFGGLNQYGQTFSAQTEIHFPNVFIPNPSISITSITKPPCIDSTFPLIIRNPTCEKWHIDSLAIGFGTGGIELPNTFDSVIGPNETDTIWLSSNVNTPGSAYAYLDINMSSPQRSEPFDTSVYCAVSVPFGAPIAVASSSLSLSNCKPSIVPILLQALSCDSMEFSSCAVSVGKQYHYSTNLPFPLTLLSGETDSLLIDFPPQSLSGTIIVSVTLVGHFLGTSIAFDTTLEIRVTFLGESSALAAVPASLTFDSLSMCNVWDSTATFTNLGCDTIVVLSDETAFGVGWSATDPMFPDTLPPDSMFSIVVYFVPNAVSSYIPQTLTYSFQYPGGKESTTLQVVGSTVPVTASFSMSDTGVAWGPFNRCFHPTIDTTVTVTNTGCDSLMLTSTSVDGGNGFTLVDGNDTVLGPSQSAIYDILFSDSIAGTFISAFHLVGIGAHGGNTIDTTVPLAASIVEGNRSASIDLDSIDFGTTSICEERDSFVTITNTGCEADTLHGFTFSNAQFASNVNLLFPFILLPDSSTTVPILTALDTTGHAASNAGMLSFALDSGVTVPTVSLTREIQYPVAFALALSAPASAGLDTTLPVIVTRTGTVPSQANELDFDVIYNDNLLSFAQALEPDIMANTGTILPNGLTDRAFRMVPARDRDTIATLYFKTYLTKETTTDIGLSQERFLVNTAISPPCVAALDTLSTPQRFTLDLDCGDSIILAAWNAAPPFTIQSIVPNPASTDITIRIAGGIAATSMNVELYDVLGQNTTPQPPLLSNEGAIHLDVSNLSSGNYYLRCANGSYTVTRKIQIAR